MDGGRQNVMLTDGVEDRALAQLLGLLRERGYRFVTPTPATHARVVTRADRELARSLEDVLGWSLPFADDAVDPAVLQLLQSADAVEPSGTLWRSRVRVSSLGQRLFLHSAYPTTAQDAVFFGPDSYRFADFLHAELTAHAPPPRARMADICTGAGVGAAVLGDHCPDADIVASDLNGQALRFAHLNLADAHRTRFVEAPGVSGLQAPLDIISINPPFIVDGDGRAYRDGGGMHGGALSLSLATDAMTILAPGGRLLLYTGSAIVSGNDAFHDALLKAASARGCTIRYRELDPDIFGEELDAPAYADVDRIAAIGAVVTRTA